MHNVSIAKSLYQESWIVTIERIPALVAGLLACKKSLQFLLVLVIKNQALMGL